MKLRNLYNCIQKNQYRQVQNYLEGKKPLASAVIKVYEKLSSNLLNEVKKMNKKIDNLLDDNSDVKQDIDNIQTIPGIEKKLL